MDAASSSSFGPHIRIPPLKPPRKRLRILDPESLPRLIEPPRLEPELLQNPPERLRPCPRPAQVLRGEFDQHPARLESGERLAESGQRRHLGPLDVHLHRVDPLDPA